MIFFNHIKHKDKCCQNMTHFHLQFDETGHGLICKGRRYKILLFFQSNIILQRRDASVFLFSPHAVPKHGEY